mgnify:CR=1 FL=1
MTQKTMTDVAIGRRVGTSPIALENMREADAASKDWRATCLRCRDALTGSLVEIRKHRCDGTASTS